MNAITASKDFEKSARPLGLTKRELECIEHLLDGRTVSQMAGDLGLSQHTAYEHISKAKAKTGDTTIYHLCARVAAHNERQKVAEYLDAASEATREAYRSSNEAPEESAYLRLCAVLDSLSRSVKSGLSADSFFNPIASLVLIDKHMPCENQAKERAALGELRNGDRPVGEA
ncbi:hypothetical protein GCM10007094_23290 [Pseudovibrio japonicus]|uniref:HTH luxR-type domain-containing protein n=1 Tax=Pseudovibrio japonicus TaxID=366534 RepID=A0ABQ3EG57_9HYPH|nr:LuxR C-terminal-related transcriptional regulator [Pseudovibrio japonicus]GHB33774.1 hypothetical protein GCM10007094_23290 [Pseudovibrio japonicus]